MISINDFYKKLKRQYINLSLINAASFKHYLMHLLSFCIFYLFGKGKSAFPLNITLDLSYECNLNCKFCFLYFLPRASLIREEAYLTYKEIEKLVVPLKGKGTTFLITGGEPTLRKDLVDIVKLIKTNKFRCGIFTNAICLTPEISDSLTNRGLDYLLFSLDGPKDVHDRLRSNGAFDKAYNNIDYIIKRREHSNPKIIMNVLILQENYQRLTEIIDIAYNLNVDAVAFDFLTFLTNREFEIHKTSFEERFPDNEFKSLVYVRNFLDKNLEELPCIINDVRKYAKAKGVHTFLKPDLTKKEMGKWFSSSFRFHRRCIYPWNVLRISPYGDVYPCAQFYIKIGNIRENTIEEIWNNKKFCSFRNMLKKRKLFPGCNKCVKL